jgi:hypothetical protein
MKRNLLLITLFVFFFSCSEKSDKKADEQAQVKSVNTVADPKKQKLERLRSMAAMDLEELKSLLPLEVNGIKRTNLSVSSALGYGMAHADYENKTKTDFRVTLYDCSGATGAGLYESIFLNRLNQPKNNEEVTVKTIDFKGEKAIEKMDGKTKTHTLTFLTNERVLVIVSGRNVDTEAMMESVQKLNF